MQPTVTVAAVCAAFLTFLPAARADDTPQPESRKVIEPPSREWTEEQQPAEAPRAEPPPRAAHTHRGDIGFQLRVGAADTDRVVFGGSFGVGSGPLIFGLSGDAIADVQGSGRHYDDGDDEDHDWCRVRSNGRCLNQVDASFSGYGGLRYLTAPVIGPSRIRLEAAGELGWQLSYVDERLSDSYGTYWSDAHRAYPFVGVRGGAGLTFLGGGHVGVGAFARQGISGEVCVDTDGGCVHVGGFTAGVYLFGGADWGVGH